MEVRELEKVKSLIFESTGLDLGYAYDDLVFSEHGIFIIQFDAQNSRKLYCYFNSDCYDVERDRMLGNLVEKAGTMQFDFSFRGSFSMKQLAENQEIEIVFNTK
jgi:hypothetical protein